MNKSLLALLVLVSLSSVSYGKCKLAIKNTPTLPDAHTANFKEMAQARIQVEEYLISSKTFIACSNKVNQQGRRTTRVMKSTQKLIAKYNKASNIFSTRAQTDPTLLKKPDPMIAAN
jgi:hypothetical protein